MNEDTQQPTPRPENAQTPPPDTGGSALARAGASKDRARHGRGGRWRRHQRPREYRETIDPPLAIETYPVAELLEATPKELQKRLGKMGVEESFDRPIDAIKKILKTYAEQHELKGVEGTLDMGKGGFGFLRSPLHNYVSRPEDIFVPPHFIRQYGLKAGDQITGIGRLPRENERYVTLAAIDLIWDDLPDKIKERKSYDELTPLFPDKRLILECGAQPVSMRAIDLLSPLGRGQRALIVAPPRAGKTVLLQQIAHSLGVNSPDAYVIVLLVDERPEEVGNMIPMVKNGEVIASTFDEPLERHVRVAEFVMEKSHRMIESGKHVVVLMDSLTRFARACNNLSSGRGRLMSGGVEAGALIKPRKFFSSARNVEQGGSLTIVATVLTETGSRMDDLIFEEFKGTGNMEIYLSRDLQQRRIYPAIHIEKTGTRREDLLYHPDELHRIQVLRKQLSEYPPLEAMEKLVDILQRTGSNAEMLMRLRIS